MKFVLLLLLVALSLASSAASSVLAPKKKFKRAKPVCLLSKELIMKGMDLVNYSVPEHAKKASSALLKVLKNEESILADARKTRIIVHKKIIALLDVFLEEPRKDKNNKLYYLMSEAMLISRLFKKKPLLLDDQKRFVLASKASLPSVRFSSADWAHQDADSLLSLAELQFASLVGISGPVDFYAGCGAGSQHESSGYLIGIPFFSPSLSLKPPLWDNIITQEADRNALYNAWMEFLSLEESFSEVDVRNAYWKLLGDMIYYETKRLAEKQKKKAHLRILLEESEFMEDYLSVLLKAFVSHNDFDERIKVIEVSGVGDLTSKFSSIHSSVLFTNLGASSKAADDCILVVNYYFDPLVVNGCDLWSSRAQVLSKCSSKGILHNPMLNNLLNNLDTIHYISPGKKSLDFDAVFQVETFKKSSKKEVAKGPIQAPPSSILVKKDAPVKKSSASTLSSSLSLLSILIISSHLAIFIQ